MLTVSHSHTGLLPVFNLIVTAFLLGLLNKGEFERTRGIAGLPPKPLL